MSVKVNRPASKQSVNAAQHKAATPAPAKAAKGAKKKAKPPAIKLNAAPDGFAPAGGVRVIHVPPTIPPGTVFKVPISVVIKAEQVINKRLFENGGGFDAAWKMDEASLPAHAKARLKGFVNKEAFNIPLSALLPGQSQEKVFAVRAHNQSGSLDELMMFDSRGKMIAHGQTGDNPAVIGFAWSTMAEPV